MSDIVKVTPTVALRILEFQAYRCALTGRELTPEMAVLDHIVPVSRGGAHAAQNIWVLHRDVNQAKGKLLLSEFYAMCEEAMANRAAAARLLQAAAAGWNRSPVQEDIQ